MEKNLAEISPNAALSVSKPFLEMYDGFVEIVGNTKDSDALKKAIHADFRKLCGDYIQSGNTLFKAIGDGTTVNLNEVYLIHYSIPEYFKDIAFLARDILLQLLIGKIRRSEGLATPDDGKNHFSASKDTFLGALSLFSEKVNTQQLHLSNLAQQGKTIDSKIKHQHNPWPVYQEQFGEIIKQILKIQSSESYLLELQGYFDALKETTLNAGLKNKQFNDQLTADISDVLETLKKEDFDNLTLKIDTILLSHEKMGNSQALFTEELGRNINHLHQISVPVRSEDGFLKIRDLNLNRSVQKWFDFEILPYFMDLIGQENIAKAKCQVCLKNLQSVVQHDKNRGAKADAVPMVNIVKVLLEDLNVLGTTGGEISQRIATATQSKLIVSNLFKNEPFLEVSLNSTISSSLDVGRNRLVENLLIKYRYLRQYFSAKYKASEYHESFSEIELTTKCIAHRMFKEENEHYDTLFLTKNFIGDLFLIMREQQEKKFAEAISQWKNGFPKAVLVSGERLSGRTTFSMYVAKKYFGKDLVVLKPDSDSTIDGRKFSTTHDLKEALQYVKKHNSKSTLPIIVIDDVELWRDPDHGLLDNIRALISFIENESDNALVLAICSDAMKNYFDTVINFSNVFSTQIDTSKSGKNEILEAILLRHGAGHRTLISKDGEEIFQQKIKTLVSRMSKKYNYNIGEVLQAWTYNTFVQEGQKVLFLESDPEFLDFFSKEELIILKQSSLFKIISEYGLRRLIPIGFDSRFKSGVKRLLNTKVLLRDLNGNLAINPVVLYDIRRILEQKHYLRQ
jgi:hypothetical protein